MFANYWILLTQFAFHLTNFTETGLRVRKMYHTQEKRSDRLPYPIPCKRADAWLGTGWYFWYSEADAIHWGNNSKKRTGYYDVYTADLVVNNILDTVFNEDHYNFWIKQIQKASEHFFKKLGVAADNKMLNRYFYDRQIWKDVDGIMVQDISNNPSHYLIKGFQHVKRIQLVSYKLEIIHNFAHHFEGQCV